MPRLLKIALDCSAWALLLAAAPFANAAEVEEAWGLFWRGQAEEAEEQFTELAEKEPRGALGLARVLTERGETAEAETQLTAAMEKFPEAGELPAERASLAFHRGDYEAARVHIAEALALDENQPLARWLTAELHRVEGRIPEADRAYAWFIDRHNRGRDLDLESLYYIGEAAAQYASWRRNSSQFNFLVHRQ